MAKKDPTDLSVEDKLKTLYQLQTALSSIDEQRAVRGELPLEIQDLADEIEGLTIRLEKINNEIQEFTKAVEQKTAERIQAEASVARYQMQIDDVKNNREYDMLSKEIEYQNLEIELCSKKILEAQQQIAERQAEIAANQEELEENKSEIELKRSELDDIMDETRAEEERLKQRASELEAKIEPRLLASFKRIRRNARNGLGIVYVQRDACGGCFNKIPPQRQLDIKMHKKIIVCEYCGRIMIDPELAGIRSDKLQTADEKKPKKKRTVKRAAKKEEQ